MSFEDVMGVVIKWATATEALAALGAEVSLQQSAAKISPEIVSALRAVSAAGGVNGMDELAAAQQAILLGIIRLYLHQAVDLVDHPDRPPGWTFTDPEILDGFGRGSSMIPSLIASAHPRLGEVTSFLDVGTGVGLLAIAAAKVWPGATVVGIDPWEVSLDRARSNVAQAGLEDRITLRRQELADIEEIDAYDCAWIPTFFLTEAELEQGLPGLVRAVRPGGWIILGRDRQAPDPLAAALANLRWTRGGGSVIGPERAIEILENAGCTAVRIAQPAGPAPLEFVLGQRPAT